MLQQSINRGILCTACYTFGNFWHAEESFSSTRAATFFVYGLCTYPILFCNYRFTSEILYRQLKYSKFAAATVNEVCLWPITALPALFIAQNFGGPNFCVQRSMQQYSENVVYITCSSAVFWVPFTMYQYKFPLQKFASIRLSASLLYNTILNIYTKPW